MRTAAFFEYARKRQQIKIFKDAGFSRPWSDDPILNKYRFCNVFREDDRNTIWYKENLRDVIGPYPSVQLRAAAVFRYINRIETMEKIKHLLMVDCWDADEFERILREHAAQGRPIVGAAYIVKSPNGMDKIAGIRSLLEPVIADADKLSIDFMTHRSLEHANQVLTTYPWIGDFMAYEIVSDLRWTRVLIEAQDILSWANPGPGATRGIGRLMSEDGSVQKGFTREDKLNIMRKLLQESFDSDNWPCRDWGHWEMREVEHNLCEFDKYERARLGEGTPKQFYKPHIE